MKLVSLAILTLSNVHLLFTEQNRYGVGMLARDDAGVVVQGRSDSFEGIVRLEIAEAIAVKEASAELSVWHGRE